MQAAPSLSRQDSDPLSLKRQPLGSNAFGTDAGSQLGQRTL